MMNSSVVSELYVRALQNPMRRDGVPMQNTGTATGIYSLIKIVLLLRTVHYFNLPVHLISADTYSFEWFSNGAAFTMNANVETGIAWLKFEPDYRTEEEKQSEGEK